jgi:hypothetical protein
MCLSGLSLEYSTGNGARARHCLEPLTQRLLCSSNWCVQPLLFKYARKCMCSGILVGATDTECHPSNARLLGSSCCLLGQPGQYMCAGTIVTCYLFMYMGGTLCGFFECNDKTSCGYVFVQMVGTLCGAGTAVCRSSCRLTCYSRLS